MSKHMLGNSAPLPGPLSPTAQRAKKKHERVKQKHLKRAAAAASRERSRLVDERREKEDELGEALEDFERVERRHAKQLKKLQRKLREAESRTDDLREDAARERDQLMDVVEEVGREARLWEAVAASFLDEKQVRGGGGEERNTRAGSEATKHCVYPGDSLR